MAFPLKSGHQSGELELTKKNILAQAVEVETYAGKVRVEWGQTASITPMGQLPFFIQFLKLGGRTRLVEPCTK